MTTDPISSRATTDTVPDEWAHPAQPLGLPRGSEGVLPGQLLEVAIRAGYIDAGRFKIPEQNIQPASLDLRLGERAFRIRCSFLPGRDTVEHKLKELALHELDLRGGGGCWRPAGHT